MLNTFPDLLTYSLLGPFLIRVVVGIIFVDLGILKFRGEKQNWKNSFEALHLNPAEKMVSMVGVVNIVCGALLIIGLWTQVAALILGVLTLMEVAVEWREAHILKRDLVFYFLMLSILISLMMTGAGAFAVDIPL
ncbi:MAG: hypothetical protein AB200_02185 [Parcubacteria bacterium C7867-005]|nr:MAG: hypothetical protein AB200_02185 [Parcubacteria bacterium C7867-005]